MLLSFNVRFQESFALQNQNLAQVCDFVCSKIGHYPKTPRHPYNLMKAVKPIPPISPQQLPQSFKTLCHPCKMKNTCTYSV